MAAYSRLREGQARLWAPASSGRVAAMVDRAGIVQYVIGLSTEIVPARRRSSGLVLLANIVADGRDRFPNPTDGLGVEADGFSDAVEHMGGTALQGVPLLRQAQQDLALVGGVSVYFGNTEKEIELKVKTDDGEKKLKYLPVAAEPALIPQYTFRSKTE